MRDRNPNSGQCPVLVISKWLQPAWASLLWSVPETLAVSTHLRPTTSAPILLLIYFKNQTVSLLCKTCPRIVQIIIGSATIMQDCYKHKMPPSLQMFSRSPQYRQPIPLPILRRTMSDSPSWYGAAEPLEYQS